ncbi:MAG: sigma factor-like helix-turn-helix DNA-binding protein, partial [Pontimonas sp.]
MKQPPRVTDPFFGLTRLTQSETAEILEVTKQAVWTYEKRAFTKLRKAFETEIGKEE